MTNRLTTTSKGHMYRLIHGRKREDLTMFMSFCSKDIVSLSGGEYQKSGNRTMRNGSVAFLGDTTPEWPAAWALMARTSVL
jgi:hypothetical protein